MLDNFVWMLLLGLVLLFIFTYINIYIDVEDLFTTFILTIFFFYIYVKTPISFVNRLYNMKEYLLKEAEKDKSLTDYQRNKIKKMFRSRIYIFISFFQSGLFSYKYTLTHLINYYKERSIKIRFRLHFNISGKTSKDLEDKIFKDISDDFRFNS